SLHHVLINRRHKKGVRQSVEPARSLMAPLLNPVVGWGQLRRFKSHKKGVGQLKRV
ncbi:hypothetical protein HID58_068720, partial [Brassica napus]